MEQSETNTGVPVEEARGNAAYGDGDTWLDFADAGRTLIASSLSEDCLTGLDVGAGSGGDHRC